jgi:ribosomal-protein-alanine N-acetyltransferase
MAIREVTSAGANLGISVERMTEHDLLEVVEIEALSGLSAWGWEAYYKELQSAQDVIMLVARTQRGDRETGESPAIAGFIISRLVAGEVHVNNVAVRNEFRRQGIAVQLLAQVIDWGRRRQARLALLEVRAGNTEAQALYSRCGFQIAGRRRRYYSQPVEDALLMTISLSASP